MKNLTLKFRNTFQNYDYNHPDIDILLILVETILDIMQLISQDDCEDMKKLSSFVKLISEEKDENDIGFSDTIDYVYEYEIIPLLVKLDNKYETTEKEIDDTLFDKFNTDSKKVEYKEDSLEFICDYEITNEQILEQKLLFDIMKSTVNRASIIYGYIIDGKVGDVILRELCEISVSSELTEMHSNPSIRKISSALHIMTDFFINVINTGQVIEVQKQEEIYESIESMKSLEYYY